jgi:DNA-binding CsgD family transcriptional regulator
VLAELLEALAGGRGGSVLVVGEAGAGKSALVAGAFAGWRGGDGAGLGGVGVLAGERGRVPGVVVWAVGDEMGAEFPLMPWVEAVRGVAGTEDAGGQVEAAGEYRPLALAEAITSRLDALSPEGRQMLSAAALLGVEFAVPDLGLASGLPVIVLAGLLGQAREAGVLAGTQAGMAFRHPLIRDVLYQQMSAGVRAAWHLDLARMLTAEGAPVSAVARQLAAALAAGGELPAADWVVDWLVTNGAALSWQTGQLAITVLSRAWEQLPPGNPRRAALAVPLARALVRNLRGDDAERVARQTLATVPGVSAEQALELHVAAAESRVSHAPRWEPLIALLDAAEAERERRPEQLLRLRVLRSREYAWAGSEEEKGRDLAAGVLEAATRYGDRQSAGWACLSLGRVDVFGGDLDAARGHFGHGITVTEGDPESLEPHMTLLALQARAMLPDNLYAEAGAVLSRARALAEKTGNELRLCQIAGIEVYRLFAVGNWDDLLTELDAVPQGWWVGVQPWGAAVVVARHRDDIDLAGQYWDRIQSPQLAGRDMTYKGGFFDYVRGVDAEYLGDTRQALRCYAAALEVRPPDYLNLTWMACELPLPEAVRLALADGDRDTAAGLVEQAGQLARWPRFAAILAHGRGLLQADPDLVQRAVDYYRQVGKRLPFAQALESLAAVLVQQGAAGRARPLMIEALQAYESLGAAWDVKRMRARFRKLGMRLGSRQLSRRAASGWNSMTRTETTVAVLVAEGLSNPQIAERLFLSRRTVETHISHIITKLHAHSRVDIALAALKQPGATPASTQATRSTHTQAHLASRFPR